MALSGHSHAIRWKGYITVSAAAPAAPFKRACRDKLPGSRQTGSNPAHYQLMTESASHSVKKLGAFVVVARLCFTKPSQRPHTQAESNDFWWARLWFN
jgi:hypothetical protein